MLAVLEAHTANFWHMIGIQVQTTRLLDCLTFLSCLSGSDVGGAAWGTFGAFLSCLSGSDGNIRERLHVRGFLSCLSGSDESHGASGCRGYFLSCLSGSDA